MSAVFGLMIATIGIDLQSGQARFTMGVPEFLDGVGLLVVIVGLFAVGECLRNVEKWFEGTLTPIPIKGKLWFTKEEWSRSVGPITRGGLIGFAVGVLPGAGGTIATILAYATEQKLSKHPEKFGTGMVEGVAAPEAANNGSTVRGICAAADTRRARIRRYGRAAGRFHHVRHPARAHAVPEQSKPGVGSDQQHVHR